MGHGSCLLLSQCVDAKKHCWYFEGGYPIYFMYVRHHRHHPTPPVQTHPLVSELAAPLTFTGRSQQRMDVPSCQGLANDLRDKSCFQMEISSHKIRALKKLMCGRNLQVPNKRLCAGLAGLLQFGLRNRRGRLSASFLKKINESNR